jgi:hypothetical protein
MKKKVIKTASIGLVALGTSVMAQESTNIAFGSSVGEFSIEAQMDIEASKGSESKNYLNWGWDDSPFPGPPSCKRQCDPWRIVVEKHDDKDLSLAEDMSSLLS